MILPLDIFGEIVKYTHDLDTLCSLFTVLGKDAPRHLVTHITSERFRVVSVDFIASLPNLVYADNIGVRVDPGNVHELAKCPKLRRLAIQACRVPIQTLVDVLRIKDKVDDQYWKIRVVQEYTVFVKDGTVATSTAWDLPMDALPTLRYRSYGRIFPSVLYDRLAEASKYMSPVDRDAVKILLKYQAPIEYTNLVYTLYKRYVGSKALGSYTRKVKKIYGVVSDQTLFPYVIPLELMPYYDIPRALSIANMAPGEAKILAKAWVRNMGYVA